MWHDMRNGRLTSSNFHSIHTKVNSINNKPAVVQDVKLLVKHIIGYTKVNLIIKSLKYGREMEPVAKVFISKNFVLHILIRMLNQINVVFLLILYIHILQRVQIC